MRYATKANARWEGLDIFESQILLIFVQWNCAMMFVYLMEEIKASWS